MKIPRESVRSPCHPAVLVTLQVMARYTNEEKTNMVLMYCAANFSQYEARRLYQERFPGKPVPGHRMFERVHRQLRETGSFNSSGERTRRPHTARSVNLEEEIIEELAANPAGSVRYVANRVGASRSTVQRVLADDGQHAYHLQRVQAIQPTDYEQRVDFCRWFLRQTENQPEFPGLVLFTDEATFSQEGVFNTHNLHLWAQENPRKTRPHSFQTKFTVNVWAGILGDHLIGPYLLPDRLTGQYYYNFLREILPDLLQDVDPNLRRSMWFQHDGAPAHFCREVRELLNDTYPNHWIGRGGPIAWPPRSPDLTSLDFFLWGHLKSLVYETPVENHQDLVARIVVAADKIKENPAMLARVRESMRRRYIACVEVDGRTFEQLL